MQEVSSDAVEGNGELKKMRGPYLTDSELIPTNAFLRCRLTSVQVVYKTIIGIEIKRLLQINPGH